MEVLETTVRKIRHSGTTDSSARGFAVIAQLDSIGNLYSTVSEPAVDTDPAQHHLSSFASQFVGIAFMGRRRRGAYDFGRRFSGFGHLESPPSQQILEEGLGRLILARRGRRPDGKRRASNLKTLGLS